MNFLALLFISTSFMQIGHANISNEKIFKSVYENFKGYQSEMSDLEIYDGEKIKSATFYYRKDSDQLNFYLNFKKPKNLEDTKLWLQLTKDTRRVWIQIRDGKKREIKADNSGNIRILGTEFDVGDLVISRLDYEELKKQKPSDHLDSISFKLSTNTKVFLQKQSYLPIKITHQNLGRETKSILLSDFKNYEGILLPDTIQAQNHINQKTSKLIFKNRFVNIQLSPNLFEVMP